MYLKQIDQTNDLTLWPILRRLSKDFLLKVDKFFIFNNGESILLFCYNGKKYGFGQNINGLLGVTTTLSTLFNSNDDNNDDDNKSNNSNSNNNNGNNGNNANESVTNTFRMKCLNVLRLAPTVVNCCCPTTLSNYYIWDKPREIQKLRNIHIKSISLGEKHIMALSTGGDLYGWGLNNHGQLGIGWYRLSSMEPTLILSDVKKVCCGPKHTVALMDDGSIRLWGKFPGCPHNSSPERLVRAPTSMIDLISTKLLTVAYNNEFDEHDRSALFAWGDLKQFGLSGSSTVRLTYKKCDYRTITKIIPIGTNKILVLTNEGRLSIISIQNERVRSIRNPFRFLVDLIDYCSECQNDLNVAIIKDRSGKYFIWDDQRPDGQNLFQSYINSIPDACCLYSSCYTPSLTKLPQELVKKMIEHEEKSSSNSANHKHLKQQQRQGQIFNDPRKSDFIFRFKNYQQKPIYCHLDVLINYSKYFAEKYSKLKDTITVTKPYVEIIESNSYITMFYYLRFIYIDLYPELNPYQKLSIENFHKTMLIELYEVAEKFDDLKIMDRIIDEFYPKNYYSNIVNDNNKNGGNGKKDHDDDDHDINDNELSSAKSKSRQGKSSYISETKIDFD